MSYFCDSWGWTKGAECDIIFKTIRFNPLDGMGVKNENVTRFTYALVESDDKDALDEIKVPE